MNHYKCFNSYQKQVEDAKRFKGLPLYRLFEEEWQAESLLNGKIWISTLEQCRNFEDNQQGDKHEGSSIFNFSMNAINRYPTNEERKHALYCGIDIGPNCHAFIGNAKRINQISNGFILCTTNNPLALQKQSNAWKYGVKIDLPPRKFAYLLFISMLREGIELSSTFHHGWTKYGSERNYYSLETEPQRLAFLKPQEHENQSEYRFFVMATENFKYPEKGILINCPEIIQYLSKI